jgi:hypothetical protein
MRIKFWWVNLKGEDYWEDQGVYGRIIPKDLKEIG